MEFFASKGAQPDSFGKQKVNTEFINYFLNNPLKIVDLRNEDGIRIKQLSNYSFEFNNNQIACKTPSNKFELINLLHARSLYHELSLSLILKDGYIENSKIYDLKDQLQPLTSPKIISKEVQEPTNTLYLDHPERLFLSDHHGGYELKVDYDEEIFKHLTLDSFSEFNQGTDFFIINNKCDSLEKLINNYQSGLYSKTATIISCLETSFIPEKTLKDMGLSEKDNSAFEKCKDSGWSKHYALFPFKKKLRKANEQIVLQNNQKLKSKTFFKAKDIIKHLDNKSYFLIPINLLFFKTKQYNRFSNQLKTFLVPHDETENGIFLYDSKRSDLKTKLIPEKIRNEFYINNYLSFEPRRTNPGIPEKEYQGLRYNINSCRSPIFARLDFLR